MKVIIEHTEDGAWYVWGPRRWPLGLRDCLAAGMNRDAALDSARRKLKEGPSPRRVTTREKAEL